MDLGTPVERLLPESRREMACGLGGSRGEGSGWTGKMLRLNGPQALGASRGWMDKVHR